MEEAVSILMVIRSASRRLARTATGACRSTLTASRRTALPLARTVTGAHKSIPTARSDLRERRAAPGSFGKVAYISPPVVRQSCNPVVNSRGGETVTHLDENEVERFLGGDLPPDEQRKVVRHLLTE